jgi:hypothetical protein
VSDSVGDDTEREGIDELLGEKGEQRLNDEEWEIALEYVAHFEGNQDYELACDYIVRVRVSQADRGLRAPRARHHPFQEVGAVEVPEHWRRRTEQLFAEFAFEAEVARLIVGLEGPRPVEGLGEFLARIAARERVEGDFVHLDYLDMIGNPKRLALRRGYTHKQLRDAVERGEARRLPAPRPVGVSEAEHRANPTPVAGRNLMEDWIAPRTNRLCRVADLAAKLAKKTGCGDAEATLFLLCDQTPEPPWLEAQVFEFRSDRRRAFVIGVGSPLVPAEDLRRFYVQVREQATVPDSGGRLRRGTNPWTLELLDFVEERRRQWISWQTIFEEWNELNVEHAYKSLPGMQRSYYEARNKPATQGGFTFYPRVFRPRSPK